MHTSKNRRVKKLYPFSFHFASRVGANDLVQIVDSAFIDFLRVSRVGESSGEWKWSEYALDGQNFRCYVEPSGDHNQVLVCPIEEQLFTPNHAAWESWFLACCQEMEAVIARTVQFGGWTRICPEELTGELHGLDHLQFFGPELSKILTSERLVSAFPRHQILAGPAFMGWLGDSPFVDLYQLFAGAVTLLPVSFQGFVKEQVDYYKELLLATPPASTPYKLSDVLAKLRNEAAPAALEAANEAVNEWKSEFPGAEQELFDFLLAAWLIYGQNQAVLQSLKGNKDLALVRWAVVLGPQVFSVFAGAEDGLSLLRRFIARFDAQYPQLAENFTNWAIFYNAAPDELRVIVQELANTSRAGNKAEPVSIEEIHAAIKLIAWTRGYRPLHLRRWVLNRYLLGGAGFETVIEILTDASSVQGALNLEWINICRCDCSECLAFRAAHLDLAKSQPPWEG